MDEMVSYIFRSMRSSELTLRGVKRVLKNQARRNRNFKRFAWLTVGYLVISEINRSLMEKKIKELDEEIKKLKQEEGESQWTTLTKRFIFMSIARNASMKRMQKTKSLVLNA